MEAPQSRSNGNMKTLFYLFVALASFLLVLPAAAMAVEYHVANQITLTWDVTPPNNAGEKIEYAIYIAPSGDFSYSGLRPSV
jgi:hypothetical protein